MRCASWLQHCKSNPLWVVVAAIILSRWLAGCIFEAYFIINDSGVAIKLGGAPAYLDYRAYSMHAQTAWSDLTRPFVFVRMLSGGVDGAWHWLTEQPLKPGPIFPALLGWAHYERSALLLSALYMLGGSVLGWVWAHWLRARGAALWLQLAAACFPALVYYSFIVSTDLLYALVIAVWLSSAWAVLNARRGAWIALALSMVLALLIRPNALALLPLMSVLAWQRQDLRVWLVWSLFWALAGVYMLIYYLPYYWVHAGNASATHYWGILPAEYYKGLWGGLPTWLSQPVSWLMLAASKLLHAVGLRPSYAGLEGWLVFVRALPGVLFLPGLMYGLIKGHWFDRCFLVFFMLPVFVGAAQERYLLAVSPLLLLWGVRAWQEIGDRVRRFMNRPGNRGGSLL